jgi:hypothetical protein
LYSSNRSGSFTVISRMTWAGIKGIPGGQG